jgi:hypothetical protein
MDADQLDDPVLYRQELIKTHSRRLKALEIKASKYGLEWPVSIEVKIIAPCHLVIFAAGANTPAAIAASMISIASPSAQAQATNTAGGPTAS